MDDFSWTIHADVALAPLREIDGSHEPPSSKVRKYG